jgi:hypothetical protein
MARKQKRPDAIQITEEDTRLELLFDIFSVAYKYFLTEEEKLKCCAEVRGVKVKQIIQEFDEALKLHGI